MGGGISNPLNTGRNLADIFNSEIAKYTSPWEWIQDRIDMGCYSGLDYEDFLPLANDSNAQEMQIAGKNTYTRTTNQNLGNHIDFISRDCHSQAIQWNTTDTNNGTVEQPYPYLASNVYKFLNEDLYNKLPEDVKKVITQKRTLLESRYSSSGKLINSTSWGWTDIGKLWLPTEYEVLGSVAWGTKGRSAGQVIQYPIFANSWKNRIKKAGANGEKCHWQLSSVSGDSSTHICGVSSHGYIDTWTASFNNFRVPICFRIAAQH